MVFFLLVTPILSLTSVMWERGGVAHAGADTGGLGVIADEHAPAATAAWVAYRYDELSRLEARWYLSEASALSHGDDWAVAEVQVQFPEWMVFA